MKLDNYNYPLELREKALKATPIGKEILKNSVRVQRDKRTVELVRNDKYQRQE